MVFRSCPRAAANNPGKSPKVTSIQKNERLLIGSSRFPQEPRCFRSNTINGSGSATTATTIVLQTVGEIVDYENIYLLCYVRGPEGLIVELAERLDGAPR